MDQTFVSLSKLKNVVNVIAQMSSQKPRFFISFIIALHFFSCIPVRQQSSIIVFRTLENAY